MGVYGIYIMVLTLIVIAYYMIVIGMDLYGSSKKGQSSSSELIKVEGAEEVLEDTEEDAPTRIGSGDIFGDDSSKQDEEVNDEDRPMTAEEIAAMQTDVMYEESMKARQKMEEINPKAQKEFSLTTDKDELLNFYNLDQLAGAGNYHNEEDGYE